MTPAVISRNPWFRNQWFHEIPDFTDLL